MYIITYRAIDKRLSCMVIPSYSCKEPQVSLLQKCLKDYFVKVVASKVQQIGTVYTTLQPFAVHLGNTPISL